MNRFSQAVKETFHHYLPRKEARKLKNKAVKLHSIDKSQQSLKDNPMAEKLGHI